VWVDVFQAAAVKANAAVPGSATISPAPFPMKSPALFSMPLSFAVGIIVSLLKPAPEEAAKFESEMARTYAGIGAE
jgi:Na+(H+)/acetate symporter ActP